MEVIDTVLSVAMTVGVVLIFTLMTYSIGYIRGKAEAKERLLSAEEDDYKQGFTNGYEHGYEHGYDKGWKESRGGK